MEQCKVPVVVIDGAIAGVGRATAHCNAAMATVFSPIARLSAEEIHRVTAVTYERGISAFGFPRISLTIQPPLTFQCLTSSAKTICFIS
jgi:hypothetical protein